MASTSEREEREIEAATAFGNTPAAAKRVAALM
jgi:hypothetical protein